MFESNKTKDQEQFPNIWADLKDWLINYRGISGKISHNLERNEWTYYVYLRLNNFEDKKLAKSLWITAKASNSKSEKFWETRKWHKYNHNSFLNNIDFHGGITWYAKQFSSDDSKVIEVGCDYSHYGDEGQHYSLFYLMDDIKRTINCVHSQVHYLIHCQGNGKLYRESQGKYCNIWDKEDEHKRHFYSNEYIQEQINKNIELRQKEENKIKGENI